MVEAEGILLMVHLTTEVVELELEVIENLLELPQDGILSHQETALLQPYLRMVELSMLLLVVVEPAQAPHHQRELIQVMKQSQLLVVVVDDVMPMVNVQVEARLEVLVQYQEVCTLVHPTLEMPDVLVLLKVLLLVLLVLFMEVAVVELVEMHAEKMAALV